MIKTFLGQGVGGHPSGVLAVIAPMEQLIAIRQMIDVSPELLADHQRLKALEKALADYERFSAEAYRLIDKDQEVKAMKLLGAMAGKAGYREDVDKARAALAKLGMELGG